jgi:molybdenum-dependent DNA-binding transcriptional regulator ModE
MQIDVSTSHAQPMIDLNDLRIFAYVASLASFSSAAEALQIHKSSVSRSVTRLEAMFQAPLLQRTTRKVVLTPRGLALKLHCVEILSRITETIGHVGQLDEASQPVAAESIRITSRARREGAAGRKPLRTLGAGLPRRAMAGDRAHGTRAGA